MKWGVSHEEHVIREQLGTRHSLCAYSVMVRASDDGEWLSVVVTTFREKRCYGAALLWLAVAGVGFTALTDAISRVWDKMVEIDQSCIWLPDAGKFVLCEDGRIVAHDMGGVLNAEYRVHTDR